MDPENRDSSRAETPAPMTPSAPSDPPESAASAASAAGEGPAPTPAVVSAADAPTAASPRRSHRALATIGWWGHGLLRLYLAAMMIVYGVSKTTLGQFGVGDIGDSLISFGEMSPMGMLWRMVAFSPLFQVLAGVAEAGAGIALLWRRTAPLGALIAIADMALVLVLNLGYDVPVKQLSAMLLVVGIVVLIPWMPRLVRAMLGHGPVPAARVPTLLPWRRADRIASGTAAVIAVLAAGAVTVASLIALPRATDTDGSAPAGVWQVREDEASPAPQAAEDHRWQRVAFGEHLYGDRSRMQLRLVDGTLYDGTYQRVDDSEATPSDAPSDEVQRIRITAKPLRTPGSTREEFDAQEPLTLTLRVEKQAGRGLHITGKDVDLVLAPDPQARLLFDRGFSWSPRADDPFNR
ncbi:hypothetical protein [Brachybacterium sp. ACRRE]|uniref:hypothetical protein n=1 Tax=Brachybacterium sp. ACRRE TaxID=2918184 RepID=UPI001EF24DE0|nr:hypothetical protein [Brachybacterium sp. ACRRE]MCG7310455.1 hypothetical protein [Brachybacterium sp. ACRRE]